MGMFMTSVSFRRGNDTNWNEIKPLIENMFKGVEDLSDNLDTEGPAYAILDAYGHMSMFLSELPEIISKLTGDYAVFANCVDSDFATLELYCNGDLLDSCVIGEVYEEFSEFCEAKSPDLEIWKRLLLDEGQIDLLNHALFGHEVFVEDQLRMLTQVTGLPIFDDEMIEAVG